MQILYNIDAFNLSKNRTFLCASAFNAFLGGLAPGGIWLFPVFSAPAHRIAAIFCQNPAVGGQSEGSRRQSQAVGGQSEGSRRAVGCAGAGSHRAPRTDA